MRSDLLVSEINKNKDGDAEITIANVEGIDVLKLTLNKDAIWEIVHFAQREMSYATELRKKSRS